MSRVIKFRAWNSSAGVMTHRPRIDFDNSSGSQVCWAYDKGGKEVFLPLMQFTGLQDSDGRDIYEGDVVTDHIGTGIIKYSCDYAAFRVVYGDGRAKWFYDYLESERKTTQVIGNIYEHPNLLDRPSESP